MTTSPPVLEVVRDAAAVAHAAADEIQELITGRPAAVLALPTGRTPLPLYAELRRRYQAGHIDFGQVQTFNLDEWVGLGPDHAGSYARFMREQLFSHVNLRPENCHLPNGLAPDLAAECAAYEELIQRAGGFGLAVLGIGRNGHIGFNEPGTPFDSRTHVALVTEETREANRWSFPPGVDPPDRAITVGIATLLEAERILLLVTGAEKAAALERALRGPVDPLVPASALQLHPRVRVIADAAAAHHLDADARTRGG